MTARLYENSGRSIYSYIIASCADPDRRAPLAPEINMRTIDNINNPVWIQKYRDFNRSIFSVITMNLFLCN